MSGEASETFDPRPYLRNLTSRPGIYRMLDADGQVIYVGKARNLKRRVTSYFRRSGQDAKTTVMVAQVRGIEVTVTHTENEALILENHLIKELRPRYNVLLRDDKSYPYIYLSKDEEAPRLAYHRGARKAPGRYFGPFPNAGAVRHTLNLLQKLFLVRQCEDSFYRNRSRPCLQYQIKRCSAPCVGLIDHDSYARDVEHTRLFLDGGEQQIIDDLATAMEAAAAALDFEQAAVRRDQIAALRNVQAHQYVSGRVRDLDIVAACVVGGAACVQVFFIRAGHNLGNKAFFPAVPAGADEAAILSAFLPQFYLDKPLPREVLLGCGIEDQAWLGEAFSEQAGSKVVLRVPKRGEACRWLELAQNNAREALAARLATRAGISARIDALQTALGLDALPRRIECFDISHTMGERPVASCVVFDEAGPVKSDYRRFNIRDIEPGDDYAAMAQAVERRFMRLKKGEGKWPDLLLIDGGRGQLGSVMQVLAELQVDGLAVAAVAKGEGRKPGLETLFLSGRETPLILPPDSPALHLVQQVRDEAHRFAITGHRQQRGRARTTSVLERIAGLGPKRRRELLRQFGGLQEVARAGVDDLARVTGISRTLAERIHTAFHDSG